MKRVQNNLQKKLYEHSLPSNRRKPNEHSDIGEIERFIREKYEKRSWMRKGAEVGAAGIPAGGISHAEAHSMSSVSTPSSEDSFVNDSSFSNSSPASANDTFSNGDSATVNNHRQRQRLANSANNSFGSSTSSQITAASDSFDRFSAPPRRQPPRSQQQQRVQQPLKSSSDDLLFFDNSDQNSSSDAPLESLINGNHGFPQQYNSHNNNNNDGSLASNMDASSSLSATFVANENAESKGSKDDILKLFDEPQHQQMHYGAFQQGIHGAYDQTSMAMNGGQMYMMNSHYGVSMQSMNSHGYGPQVSMYGGGSVSMMHINGQYQYGNGMQYGGGGMYNSAGGFTAGMFQQQQQQQHQPHHQQQQYHHHHHYQQ